MLGMLVAYDEDGNVVGTLDYLVQYDEEGKPLGLVDFEAHEIAGGENTDIWRVSNAKGSKVWPEWLGRGVLDFKVELAGPAGRKHIAALVHKSGSRRDRVDIDRAISQRIAESDGPADIRDLVGGPDRPLEVSSTGVVSRKEVTLRRTGLPLVERK